MSVVDVASPAAVLEGARAAATVAMLGGAAVLDLRHRRVPNRYWLPFLGLAALGLAADLWLHRAAGLTPVLRDDAVAAAVCAFLYGLWRLRLFGGADAKGLMVVALLMPRILPDGLPVPAALGVLALGSVVAAILPIGLLAWNAAHGKLRMPTALVGIWLPVATGKRAKVWPMEEPVEAGAPRHDGPGGADGGHGAAAGTPAPAAFRIRHDVRLRADRQERSLARLAALEAAGRSHAWFAPQVPLVAFLLPGALLWLWVRTVDLAGI